MNPSKNKPRRSMIRSAIESLESRTLMSGSADAAYTTPIIAPPASVTGRNMPLASTTAVSGQPVGYTPRQLQKAYGLDTTSFGGINGNGSGETIAIIIWGDNPNMVSSTSPLFSGSDLHLFDVAMGLPDPPSFTKLDQNGGTNYPSSLFGTGSEIALDVEWSHAMAPGANIVLIEASDNSESNLYGHAVDYARHLPDVSIISMSFGAADYQSAPANDPYLTTPAGHQGITFLASSGDKGNIPEYPSVSPNVVSVGGTSLNLNSDNSYQSESGWYRSGGGVSSTEGQPGYQQGIVSGYSTSFRTSPDISLDADPYTGVAILDSFDYGGWASSPTGGTSLSAPAMAGIVAVANQGRALEGMQTLNGPADLLPALYKLSKSTPGDFHDVIQGSNGFAAQPGYDLVTGIGTPRANVLIADLVGLVGAADIDSKYNSMGGPQSYLGAAISDELIASSGAHYRIYLGGAIYAIPGKGTFAIPANINEAWGKTSWEFGPLGYPSADPVTLSDGTICQTFERGYIQAGAMNAAVHVMSPAIVGKWIALGGPTGTLGMPLAEEAPSQRGTWIPFQHGAVYAVTNSGTFYLPAAVDAAWAGTGWEMGPMGFPSADPIALPDGTICQTFERGYIQAGAMNAVVHVMSPAIVGKWMALGGPAGSLGMPLAEEAPSQRGTWIPFQHGAIYAVTNSGTFYVPAAIDAAWAGTGWEMGPLGFPSADPITIYDGSLFQVFDNGSIQQTTTGQTIVRNTRVPPTKPAVKTILSSVAPPHGRRGAAINFAVKLVDPTGKAVVGRVIQFSFKSDAHGARILARATTDSSGVAHLIFTIPTDTRETNVILTANFAGDSLFLTSTLSQRIAIG